MAAYLVIQTLEITDPQTYETYRAQAKPHILSYGGEYLLASTKVQAFGGEWSPLRVAVIKFKDADTLRACFEDPAYLAIKPLRLASVVGKSVLVED